MAVDSPIMDRGSKERGRGRGSAVSGAREARGRLIEDEARSSVRYDNLIEWRSRR
jgi:hypothetical protein